MRVERLRCQGADSGWVLSSGRQRCGFRPRVGRRRCAVRLQGIELENPNARKDADADLKSGTESYFSDYSGFRSIKNQ